MLVPTPVSELTNVAPDLKNRRDLYFDRVAATLGLTQPLTPEIAAGVVGLEGSRVAGHPILRAFPLRSIVIGTFKSSRSVFSASQKAVYTEITLHVTDVFEDTSAKIAPDADITLAFLGGTVKSSDGKIISLLTNPIQYSLQPSRKYVMVLRYQQAPEFYTVVRNWDFTDGVVRANSSAEHNIESRGGSPVLGLTKEQLTTYLKEQISQQK
jgi:hypothetical protein